MRCLIVGRPRNAAKLKDRAFAGHGIKIELTGSKRTAIISMWISQPDAIFLDLDLADGSGLDVVKEAAGRCPHVPIFVFSRRPQADPLKLMTDHSNVRAVVNRRLCAEEVVAMARSLDGVRRRPFVSSPRRIAEICAAAH